jgi:hypothetical protein
MLTTFKVVRTISEKKNIIQSMASNKTNGGEDDL